MSGRWSAYVHVGASSGDDADVISLRAKIRALVHRSFGGSFRALYDHYGPHGADMAALTRLLTDADVGNFLTRGAWANGVMKRVDTNHDGLISWEEFAEIVGLPEATAVPPPASSRPAMPSGQGATAPPVIPSIPSVTPTRPATIPMPASIAPRREATGTPVLSRNQALGVTGGLFGFGVLLAAIRAIGAR